MQTSASKMQTSASKMQTFSSKIQFITKNLVKQNILVYLFFFSEILRHISKYLSNTKTPKGAQFCSVLVPLLVKCLVKKHQYYLKQ